MKNGVILRTFALAWANFFVYFNIRIYFFYFTYSLFKYPTSDYLFYITFY